MLVWRTMKGNEVLNKIGDQEIIDRVSNLPDIVAFFVKQIVEDDNCRDTTERFGLTTVGEERYLNEFTDLLQPAIVNLENETIAAEIDMKSLEFLKTLDMGGTRSAQLSDDEYSTLIDFFKSLGIENPYPDIINFRKSIIF